MTASERAELLDQLDDMSDSALFQVALLAIEILSQRTAIKTDDRDHAEKGAATA